MEFYWVRPSAVLMAWISNTRQASLSELKKAVEAERNQIQNPRIFYIAERHRPLVGSRCHEPRKPCFAYRSTNRSANRSTNRSINRYTNR